MLLSSKSSRGRAACLAMSYTESTVLLDPAVAHGVRRPSRPMDTQGAPARAFLGARPSFPSQPGAERPRTRRVGRCEQQPYGARGDAPRSTPIAKDTSSMVPDNLRRPPVQPGGGQLYYTYSTPPHTQPWRHECNGAGGGARRERTDGSSARRRAAASATARCGCRAMPPKRDCHAGLVRIHRGNDKRVYCRRFEVLHPMPCMCRGAGCRCRQSARVPAPARARSHCA